MKARKPSLRKDMGPLIEAINKARLKVILTEERIEELRSILKKKWWTKSELLLIEEFKEEFK